MSTPLNSKDLLAELVAMPTITDNKAETNKALDFVEDFLSARGMYCQRFDAEGSGALVATTKPTKTPKVMLVAHCDVVPAADNMFTMREADGKLFGRGVYDMKSALAGYMVVVDRLKDNLGDYDFGIMVTADEETVDLGVKHLLHEGYCPKEAAVLFDGARDWQIEKVAKGALYVKLAIADRTGHGSRPWLVNSSSLRMIKLLAEIEELFADAGPETNTLNISQLEAGQGASPNQIPAITRAVLDIRLMSDDERKRLGAAIKALLEKYGATYEIFAEFPPLEHNLDDPHMRAFAASIHKIIGVTSKGVTSYGASDAGHFLARGVGCIVTWPFGGGHHGNDEWVDAKAVDDIPAVIADYLGNMAHVANEELVGLRSNAH